MSNLQETPSIRIQHHRPGDRRLSEAQLEARERAKAFDGLPDGINPGHVLAAFKQAAPALGIAPRFVHAVDWLFGFTRPQDWQTPSRPIVWPSSELQMSRLQLERTAIKTLNRALAELGLVVMHDSPTGKRYGRRDRMGRIVEAYGFDLSILAVRYDEFRAVAYQARAEHEARKVLRRRIGAGAKRVRQCIAVARERGLVWHELAEHEAAIECMLEEAKGRRRSSEGELSHSGYSELSSDLAAIAEAIERRRDIVEKWLSSVVYSTYTDPKRGDIPTPHIPTNPYPINNNTIVVEARQVDKSAPAASSPDKNVREVRGREGLASDRISAGELLDLSPLLAAHMPPGCRHPDFTDVVEAAYSLRHELGISPALWGRACNQAVMGRETAAIALAIVAARPQGHIKTSAGGYFMGMVRKAEAGRLDLRSSIAKLRYDQRIKPVPTAATTASNRVGLPSLICQVVQTEH